MFSLMAACDPSQLTGKEGQEMESDNKLSKDAGLLPTLSLCDYNPISCQRTVFK